MLWRLVGPGSRRGRALPSRAGDVLRQPGTWAVVAGAVSLTGPRGRRAVVRGMTCSAVAAVVQFPFKLAFRRPRPLGARLLRTQRRTSSFPSGHTASDLSFMFGATQEIPLLIVPLSVATLGSHWSLMRSRIHYPSDIIAGGVVAVAVTGAAWKLWPPRHTRRRPAPALRAAGDQEASEGEPPHPRKRAVLRFVTNRMLNPLARPLLQRGLWPRTQALIETTGRTWRRLRREHPARPPHASQGRPALAPRHRAHTRRRRPASAPALAQAARQRRALAADRHPATHDSRRPRKPRHAAASALQPDRSGQRAQRRWRRHLVAGSLGRKVRSPLPLARRPVPPSVARPRWWRGEPARVPLDARLRVTRRASRLASAVRRATSAASASRPTGALDDRLARLGKSPEGSRAP